MTEQVGELDSGRHFGAARNYWWHTDFLALMARRLGLAEVGSLLDVGCGSGLWSAFLRPYLAPGAVVVGVDRDASLLRAPDSRSRIGPGARVAAHGEALPFADGAFAAATCQTLLVHAADARRILAEMIRVTRPGGLLLCAEPNQLLNVLDFDSITDTRPIDELVRRFELWLHCWRGRRQRGLGDLAIGAALPGLMRDARLENIRVWIGDRPATLLPPYETPAERAMVADEGEPDGLGALAWDEMLADVLASGADGRLAQTAWHELAGYLDDRRKALAAGAFHAAGTGFLYLVAARKPQTKREDA